MREFPPIPADGRILYYGRDRADFGFLSHFHPAVLELDGESWPSAEHFYQAQKSTNRDYRHAIRTAVSPGQAKRLAAPPVGPERLTKQSWFRKHAATPRADWNAVKLDVMRRVDLAKFTQHPELAARLLATGEAELIEDSPTEPFWGIGPDGTGTNWSGRVLAEVRSRIREGKV